MKRPNLKDYPSLTGDDSVNYIMDWNEYGNTLKIENEILRDSLKRIINRIEENDLQENFPMAYKLAKQQLIED